MEEVLKRFRQEMDLQTDDTFRAEPTFAKLLYEDDRCWILLYSEDGNTVVNVIPRDADRRMESLEVA